ncbi:MAG TPA: dihydropteroate synthase [Candidatus Binatia bacterium]|nr:dihydropteroate synthase [Candidatus Binatia bacterium]
MLLRCGSRTLDLSRPVVMGVLNVTPDSFSDGGRFAGTAAAVVQARRLVDEGAAIVDIGGESTRPGATPVDESGELRRVIPVIEAFRPAFDGVISVDTMKPAVMRAACAAGADLVNDVGALRADGALEAVRASSAGVCLMHMQGEPRTMQRRPEYGDVVAEVHGFLLARVAACEGAGIARDRIAVDPGFGFGKTLEHNLALLAALPQLAAAGYPVVVGLSRKSMFQQLLGLPLERRLAPSVAAAAIAALRGAVIIRAHDVAETVQAVRLAASLRPYLTPAPAGFSASP